MRTRTKSIKPESTQLSLSRAERLALLALSLALVVVPAAFGRQNSSKQIHASKAVKQAAADVGSTDRRGAAEATTAPPAIPSSVSPADQPANKARVSWDSTGLAIEASNSSLNQILRQVAFLTGAKLEAHTHDERVFGSYGPGPASEVLLKLLDGCGYNVLIIGGHDNTPLLEIVLSARSAATQMVANNHVAQPSEEAEDEQKTADATEGPRPEEQNPFKNSNAELPKDPEKFMQAILDRQQKGDEEQEKERQKDESQ